MPLSSSSTRQADTIFLIGVKDLEPISRCNQLPTLRQVFLRFHFFLEEKNSVRNASHSTVEELILVWQKSTIPIRLAKHCIDKLEKHHSEQLLLKKNKGRTSDTQKNRNLKFQDQLDILFEIGHNDALTMCKVGEDREFLIDQRTERKMIISLADKECNKNQERIFQRRKKKKSDLKKGTSYTSLP